MRLVLLFLVVINFSGCSAVQTAKDSAHRFAYGLVGGKDNATPPKKLTDYEAAVEIDVLWERQIGDGYEGLGLRVAPVVSDELIFSAGSQGTVEAISLKSGAVIWTRETEFPISAGIAKGRRHLFFGTSNAQVIALNSSNGITAWVAQVTSEVLASPVVGEGIVIVRTIDGKVIALDELSGKQQWIFERSVPALSIRGNGIPVIDAGRVFIGFADGRMIALDLHSGKNLWKASLAVPSGRTQIERLVDLDTDPVIINDVIYIASYQGGMSAVLAMDGDIIWSNEDVSSYSAISHDWRYLYVSDSESNIWQLDQRSGGTLWKQTDFHMRRLTAPAVYKDYVVVGDYDGYVHWLSSDDGHQLGRIQATGEAILAMPVIQDDIVYIYGSGGSLVALKAYPSREN
ncbi:MAG TPA: outer membrane protein assembly factor BamB [Methylococcaceae bacterium]|jgi:outer membrane protein assembly factor BamB|nr:outer membrane protein assembly factor BamB [Methylococcaceae bacterium]HIN68008.1 outer membrane protein assembly factor BamB [Methylococcales bacterium]HIA45282.1 outer membrane protein assembly factor BamB [Methylococcaceae bacterium]HIB62318.1 outer membrane protein assembly factor BamB [Methylococcaceae bacterium]HIO13216.1 outer membrane protein assembly factor BamB [Methylococcales bacterium]